MRALLLGGPKELHQAQRDDAPGGDACEIADPGAGPPRRHRGWFGNETVLETPTLTYELKAELGGLLVYVRAGYFPQPEDEELVRSLTG